MATEAHITKWLTEDEMKGYLFVTSGGVFKEKIIIVTQIRVIFLTRNLLWTDEVSDKFWSQLASVKLTKKGPFTSSTLRLRFFKQPFYDVKNKDMNFKDPAWILHTSSKTHLSDVYIYIKMQELYHKQQRSNREQQHNSK